MVLEDGKEYTYETTMTATAGTMDYQSAASGLAFKANVKIQVSGKTMYLKVTFKLTVFGESFFPNDTLFVFSFLI